MVERDSRAPAAAEVVAPHLPSLERKSGRRALVLRASAIEVAGFGGSQILRLAGNLVLSRMLSPAEFGLALLVAPFMSGLEMVSDLGLQASVVQNPRAEEPRFLDTVWTLQILRGIVLGSVGLLLAHPVAAIFEQPELSGLLYIASIQSLLSGFNSTSLYTLRRRLEVAPLVAVDLAGQVANSAVAIAWAWASPSVMALVAGGVANTLLRLAASHFLPRVSRPRLRWDRDTVSSVLRFGGWIFGSSALFFISRQSDRMLVGKLLGVSLLGVYSLATMIADLVGSVIERLTQGVLFPLFSQAAREGAPELRRTYYAIRLRSDLAALPALGALAVLGPTLVELLWDERWRDAGWMLQFLTLRVAMVTSLAPCETALFSLGQTRYGFYRSLVRAIWVLVGVPLGYAQAGTHGILIAMGTSELPVLLVLWSAFARAGMLRPARECLALLWFAMGALCAMLALPWIQSLRTAIGAWIS